LDLARRDAARIDRLEAEGAEVERRAALGRAVDAALMRLSVFRAFRSEHRSGHLVPVAAAALALAFGLAFGELLVLRHRVVLQDLALEDPHLDAAGAVSGLGGRLAVIDIGAQRMQRHAALTVPLHARHLGAAEAARAVDADALRAEAHRRLHGPLHRAAERNAALQLLRDALGDQFGLDLGLPDLDNVEADLAVRDLRDIAAQFVDIGALLA